MSDDKDYTMSKYEARTVSTVANITITTTGTLIGFSVGGPLGAALGGMIGAASSEVSSAIYNAITDRKRARLESFVNHANEQYEIVDENALVEGPTIYSERPQEESSEVLEHIIQAAIDEFEDLKVRHLSMFFVYFSRNPMPLDEAHLLVRTFRATSWRQLTLLGAFRLADSQAQNPGVEKPNMPTRSAQRLYEYSGYRAFLNNINAESWDDAYLNADILHLRNLGLLTPMNERSGLNDFKTNISTTLLGDNLTRFFGLDQIDKDVLLEMLFRMLSVNAGITMEYLRERHSDNETVPIE